MLFAAEGCATAEWAPGLDRSQFHISCFSFNAPAHTPQHIREAKDCGLDFLCGGIFYGACPELDAFAEEGLDASVILLPRICGGGQDSDALRKKYPLAGEMTARDPNSAVRGFFVYGANDCADEKCETHRVKFTAKGKVRAFGPNGPVDVKGEAGGRYGFGLADNSAVLVLVRR